MNYIRYFIIFISLAVPIILSAKDNATTVDSKEQVAIIAKGNLLVFDTYFQNLCSHDKIGNKSVVIDKILNLFIARGGEAYSSVDGIDITPTCAVIVSKRGTRRMPIKKLLNTYSRRLQSKRLQLTDCEIYIPEDIEKLQDGKYSCTAHVRSLNRLMGSRPVYIDYNTRNIIIDLPTDIDVRDGLVLLGDIYFNKVVKI